MCFDVIHSSFIIRKKMLRPDLTPSAILKHLRRRITSIGTPLLYSALLMYFAFRRHDTPAWAKRIVMGAFVYLFAPLDAVPDLAPVIGYTDDLGVLTYGLVLIAAHINTDVRMSARQTLNAWIGHPDESMLHKIDQLL
jgi:uncharacterized membrane protein YkvA (DUF1232 family)